MLRCQPFRGACQHGGSRRFASSRCLSTGSRLPGRQLAARCASAPDGGGSGRRRVRSLPEQAAEQMQSSMLGRDAPFGEPAPDSAVSAAATAPAAAAGGGSSAPQPEPGSWDDWMAYFYQLDDVVSLFTPFSFPPIPKQRPSWPSGAWLQPCRLQSCAAASTSTAAAAPASSPRPFISR
jgi:hypothetical protein